MSNQPNSKSDSNQAMRYEIRLKGHLDEQWRDWFGGLTITREEDGNTLLCGPVVDQSALFGLLRRIRDLGMTLLSVNRLPLAQEKLE